MEIGGRDNCGRKFFFWSTAGLELLFWATKYKRQHKVKTTHYPVRIREGVETGLIIPGNIFVMLLLLLLLFFPSMMMRHKLV